MNKQPTLAPLALGPTLTIGEILVEMMSENLGPTLGEVQTFKGPFPSGAPAIFIDQVARLGCPSSIIGAVGQDDFGAICLDRLKADGVDISAVARHSDLPTGVAFVRYQSTGRRKFIYNIAKSAAGKLSLTPNVRRVISQAGHLHVMGSALCIPDVLPILDHAIDVILKKGGTLSFDPNVRTELFADDERARTEKLLEQATILLPSGDEVEILGETGALSRIDGINNWVSQGNRECVVKHGKNGATAYLSDQVVNQPGRSVNEVDPTGAGDCFGATYVTCRRMKMDVARALAYANIAGAFAVTQQGPMEGAVDFEIIKTMLMQSEIFREGRKNV